MVEISDRSIPNINENSNGNKYTVSDSKPSNGNFSDEYSTTKKTGIIWRWFGTRASADSVEPVSLIGYLRFATNFERFLAILGTCAGILSGILQPFWYILCGKLTNILINHKNNYHSDEIWEEAMPVMIANVAIGIIVVCATFCMFFCLRYVSIHVIDALRIQYTKSLLRQDCAWIDGQKFGTLSSQLNENIEYIQQGSGDKIGNLIRCIAMLISTIVLSFISDWQVALCLVPFSPIIIALMFLMAKKMHDHSKKALDCAEKTAGVLQESIMNVKTVQSCNGQRTMITKLEKCLDEERIPGIWRYAWEGIGYGLLFGLDYVLFAILIYLGSLKLISGTTTAGDVLAVVTSVSFAAYLMGVLIPQSSFILRGQIAAGVLRKMIDRVKVPSIDCTSEVGQIIERPIGRISFRNVTFTYPTRPNKPVLNGLSWEAEPGQSVALVGHSGSGKSTSVSLLTRLYDYSSGKVEIDSIDVRDINIRSLRAMIGIVQQEPALFFGTIFDNVALGDESITIDRVEEVCRMANAHEFITQFQDGYFTQIGSGKVQLSGGQKQRLAIARALIKNPPILLLDEATSALDAESEILVQNALESASKGRTTVIIAHRLSTLRNVDKIVVIDQGRVVETGTHSELINREDGFYSQLAKAQDFQPVSPPSSMAPSDAWMQKRMSMDEIRGKVRSRAPSHTSLISSQSSFYSEGPDMMYFRLGEKGVNFFNSGIALFYRNCGENYGKVFVGFVFSILRGMEIPLYLVLFLFYYNSLESFSGNKETGPGDVQKFKAEVLWTAEAYASVALYLGPVILIACSVLGWATLQVVDRNKIRAVTNVLHQDAQFFDGPQTANAKIIQRVLTDSVGSRAALDTRAYMVWSHAAALIVLLVSLNVACWQIGLMGLALCAVEIILISWCGYRIQHGFRNYSLKDESAKLSVEIMENVRTMQLLLRENFFLEKYCSKLDRNRPRRIKAGVYEALTFAITRSFVYFSFFISFYFGIRLLRDGTYTGGEIFTISQLLGYCTEVIITISAYMNDIFKGSTSADSIIDLVNAPNKNLDKEQKERENASVKTFANLKGTVDLRKVKFAYPTRPEVFVANDLNIHADYGQTIALVGPSGSGKSTIVTLLQRFYEPISGTVKVDGVEVRKYPLKFLRSQMAVVGQEPVLFNGSIVENICLGVEDEVSMNDVREACATANASAFIESMPLSYETSVGEKGAQLSGGQKQRIAIARALVRKPKILLLDEATSALDASSEQAVQKALDSASAGRTCITIAHRLTSIQNSDCIYVIKGGQVIESGTHVELVQNERSAYSELVKKQELSHA